MPLASQHVGIELCKLWGIPHDRVLEIDINVEAVGYITANIKMVVDDLAPLTKRHTLSEIGEEA